MRARTYRAIAPADPAVTASTVSNIGRALVIVVVLLVVVLGLRYFGERRLQRAIAPASVSAATQDTITLPVNNPEWPELTELRFTVAVVDNAYILTDVDGDQFRCTNRPVTVADMEPCAYHATIQR